VRANILTLLILVFLLFLFFYSYNNLGIMRTEFLLLLPIGIGILLLTLLKAEIGLYFVVLSIIFSPEINLGYLPQHDLIVRFDDLLLGLVLFSWLARIAVFKDDKPIPDTPLNRPIFYYMSATIFPSVISVIKGEANLLAVFFHILKYIEYFLLFFMTYVILKKDYQKYVIIGLILFTSVIACLYSFPHAGKGRLGAPFEYPPEPNTYGGFLLINQAILLSIITHTDDVKKKVLSFMILSLNLYITLYTLSRCTYMAMLFLYPYALLTGKKKKSLIFYLTMGLLVMFMWKPQKVIERIMNTFKPTGGIFFGIPLDSSAAARLISWKILFLNAIRSYKFIIGHGVTTFFVDSQYVRVFGEAGIIGLITFFYLLITLYSNLIKVYNEVKENSDKIISYSALLALIGICIHAITANSFIIIRIAEPFWILMAVALKLPEVSKWKRKEYSKV